MALRYLDIFCKVYEMKSFSNAAEALLLTQPTVSTHIKTLEDDYEMKFFDRLGREVVSTKAGDILYGYAREIEKLKKEAEQSLANYSGKLEGTLEIGGSNIPGEFLLPALIGQFKKNCPDVATILHIGDTKNILEMVLKGKIEMGIVGAEVKDDAIDCYPFMSDKLVLIAPASYKSKKISPRKLTSLPLIVRERGSGSRKVLERLIENNKLTMRDLNIVAEIGSTEAIKGAVKSGVGLSVISSMAIEDELSACSIKVVEMPGLPIIRNLYIISHRLKNKSPLCSAFFELLSKQTPHS